MRFWDSFKMALHNLWHNKSRSILTIAIVFVVSLLIMAMLLLGANFMTNQESASRQVFDANGTTYKLMDKSYTNNSETNEQQLKRRADTGEVLKIMEKSVNYGDIIDTFYYFANTYGGIQGLNISDSGLALGYTAFDFPIMQSFGTVSEGRIWNKQDVNTNNIWINSALVASASAQNVSLVLGDTIEITLRENNENFGWQPEPPTEPVKSKIVQYKIAGIITPKEADGQNYYRFSVPQIFVCARYSTAQLNVVKPLDWSGLCIGYTPTPGSYNFSDAQKRMKAYVAEIDPIVGKLVDGQGKEQDRFSCLILDEMQMTMIMGLVIMGVVALLAFLILLLSIGSVANTIIISVDKNRKFIGLMKAMGLNNKGVKGIVYKEAFTSITIGIALATGVIALAQKLILTLLEKMFGGMFGMYGIETVVTFSFNALIPIGTLLAFIGMAILFSKGALNKMGKADPIAIISEVA